MADGAGLPTGDVPIGDSDSVTIPNYRLLAANDLQSSRDPERSRARLHEAVLGQMTVEGPDGAERGTVEPAVVQRESDPDDLHGQAARRWILQQLDLHGAALADRTTTPGHLTGSALVIDPTMNNVLLMLHAKLGRWLQPGGHADGDHELAGVALKEATEETGIDGLRVLLPAVDLDVHRIPRRGAEDEHLHLDLRFVVVAPPGSQPVANHESRDLRWVPISDVPSLTTEAGLLRLVDRGIKALERFSSDRPEWHRIPFG